MKSLGDENSDTVQAIHKVFIALSMRMKVILLRRS
jgi:hypothetical protein